MHLDVTLKPGIWIDPSKFIKQIADAGYEARKDDIRLVLIGTIRKEGDTLLLVVGDMKPDPQRFEIVEAMSKNEKEAHTWSEALKAATAGIGQTLEIEGFWTPANTKKNKDALPKLAVIRAEPPKPVEPGKQ